MPTSCCAKLCAHNSRNCKLKTFPSDNKRALAWEANLRRPNWQRKNHHRLCECHFEPDQFVNRKLLSDAVPTLFPTHKVTLNVYARRKLPTEPEESPNPCMSGSYHLSEDQFFVNAKEGVRTSSANVASTTFETHTPKYFSDFGSQEISCSADERLLGQNIDGFFEDSEPISYLATTVLGDEGDAEHTDSIEQVASYRKDVDPAAIIPEPLFEYLASMHNELQQKCIDCQKSEEEVLKLRKEIERLQSNAENCEQKLSASEYQIQDFTDEVQCSAEGRSDLNSLPKKEVTFDLKLKKTAKNETNRGLNNNSIVDALRARVLTLESEKDTLRSFNSQLVSEKAKVLNDFHQVKADYRRLLKEFWNLQKLNSQLNLDNEQLLESLNATENSPND